MRSSKLQRHLHKKRHKVSSSEIKKSEIQRNPDKHIDQDFEGFPHLPSTETLISPKKSREGKLAAINKTGSNQ